MNDPVDDLVEKYKKCYMSNDNVDHPSHYNQGSIECIEAIDCVTSNLNGFEGYCTGNILKYIWRWKNKNGIEDLEKAKWYINKLIEHVQKGQN